MEDKGSYSAEEVAKMILSYARFCHDPTDMDNKKRYGEIPKEIQDRLPLGRLENLV